MSSKAQQLKQELYSLDSDYLAGVISAAAYSIAVSEMIGKIKASEAVDLQVSLWNKYPQTMLSNI